MIASLDGRIWLKALAIALGVALLIGLPTRLIPNPIFVRMVPTTAIDYVIFVVSSILMGITMALPNTGVRCVFSGGIGALLAVGCPTCNKVVLMLLGSGGALTYFAPLQPFIGALSIGLLFVALWRRLGEIRLSRCADL